MAEGIAPEPSERQLLVAAMRGDRDAFGELYKRYLIDVREFCAGRIRDRGRAEELAQDVFIRAFQHIHSFRIGSPMWPWLATIARNMCADELRHRYRAVEDIVAEPPEPKALIQHAPSDVTYEEVAAHEDLRRRRESLTLAMATLRPRDRSLVWRHEVEEQSYSQIARADGITVHAARNAAWRARSALRAMLGSDRDDLHIHLLFPLVVAVRWLKHRLLRVQVRARRLLAEISLLPIETGALILVGAAFLSGSVPHSAQAEPRSPVALERESPSTARQISPSSTLEPMRTARRQELPHRDAQLEPISFELGIEGREDAGAPSAASYALEIRDHDGNTVYWEQTEAECGDGKDLAAIPEQAPVRAYC